MHTAKRVCFFICTQAQHAEAQHLKNVYVFSYVICIAKMHTACDGSWYFQRDDISNVIKCPMWQYHDIRWLRLVGSIGIQVSLAEYCLFCRALLQKRHIISSILPTKATPYHDISNMSDDSWQFQVYFFFIRKCCASACCVCVHVLVSYRQKSH